MRWFGALAALVLLSGCSTTPPSAQVPTPSPAPSPSAVARQVIPPAKTLPVVALCSQPLTTDQYGNSVPLLCTDGALNVLAWKFYASMSTRVLAAGPAASLIGVQTALCRDVNIGHATVLGELSAYDLAAAYYGWNFSSDPTDILYSISTCPR